MRKLLVVFFFISQSLFFISISFAQWTAPLRISRQGLYIGVKAGFSGGVLHAVLDADMPDQNICYIRSTDCGQSWSTEFPLSDSMIFDSMGLPSFAINDSLLSVSWEEADYISPLYNLGFRRSTDNGQTWQPDYKVLQPDNDGILSHTLGLGVNYPYILFTLGLPSDSTAIYFTLSTNSGRTWRTPVEIYQADEIYELNTYRYGNAIHFVWNGMLSHGDPGGIYYSRSTNHGRDWTATVCLRQSEQNNGTFAKLAVNERGELAVCWLDFRYSPYWFTGDIFCRISRDGGLSWENEIQLTDLSRSDEPVVVWRGNTIAVAYDDLRNYDEGKEEIYFIKSTDNGASWGLEERLSNDPNNTFNPALAISGNTIFLFYEVRDWPNPGIEGVYFRRYDPINDDISDSEGTSLLPEDFGLTVYPNPLNSRQIISFNLIREEGVTLKVFEINGREIISLANDILLKEGKHSITWDVNNNSGKKVGSGVYLIALSTHRGKTSCYSILTK